MRDYNWQIQLEGLPWTPYSPGLTEISPGGKKSEAFNNSPFLALVVHNVNIDTKSPDWFYPLGTNKSVMLQVNNEEPLVLGSLDPLGLVFGPLISTLCFTVELFIFVVSNSSPPILSWIYSNPKFLLARTIMTATLLNIRCNFQSLSYLVYLSADHFLSL